MRAVRVRFDHDKLVFRFRAEVRPTLLSWILTTVYLLERDKISVPMVRA